MSQIREPGPFPSFTELHKEQIGEIHGPQDSLANVSAILRGCFEPSTLCLSK